MQERASVLLYTCIDCLVTETDCIYCAVRAEFCETIHRCCILTFIRILLLLEAGTSLAIVKRSSAVSDDGGALDRVELRHCLLSLRWVKVKVEENVKQYYTGGGPGSSVGIVTGYGLDGPGIESRWGARFSAPVQISPGVHPAPCTMATGSFPGVKSGRGVTLTLHPLLVPWS